MGSNRRNFRCPQSDTDDEDANTETLTLDSPPNPKILNRLSFAADDDDDQDPAGPAAVRPLAAGGSSIHSFSKKKAQPGADSTPSNLQPQIEDDDEVLDVEDGEKVAFDGDDEDEEEERMWEEQQLRKGLILSGKIVERLNLGEGSGDSVRIHRGKGKGGDFDEVPSIADKAEIATRAFKEKIVKVKEAYDRTLGLLGEVDGKLLEALSRLERLEKSLHAAS